MVTGICELLVSVASSACVDLHLVAIGSRTIRDIKAFVPEDGKCASSLSPLLRSATIAGLDGHSSIVGIAGHSETCCGTSTGVNGLPGRCGSCGSCGRRRCGRGRGSCDSASGSKLPLLIGTTGARPYLCHITVRQHTAGVV